MTPGINVELVEDKVHGGLNIRKWTSFGGLTAGEHTLRAAVRAKYLVVAMDDDGKGHPTFCADEAAVEEAVIDLMYVRPDEAERTDAKGYGRALLEHGALHFEGDPSIYLFPLAI